MPVALAMLLTFLLSPCDQRAPTSRPGSGGLGHVADRIDIFVDRRHRLGHLGSAERIRQATCPATGATSKSGSRICRWAKARRWIKSADRFEQLIGDVNTKAPPAEQVSKPVLVTVQGGRFSSGVWQLVLPLLESVFKILLVVMLVIFMLLERDELRNRVIRLLGYGRLSLTTTALDEAGQSSQSLSPHPSHHQCRHGLGDRLGVILAGSALCPAVGNLDRHPPLRSLHRNRDRRLASVRSQPSHLIELVATTVGVGDVCGLRDRRSDGHRADAV